MLSQAFVPTQDCGLNRSTIDRRRFLAAALLMRRLLIQRGLTKSNQTMVGVLLRKEGEEGSVEPNVAVTAIPDAQKGERLVVIHKPLGELRANDITGRLATMGIPN